MQNLSEPQVYQVLTGLLGLRLVDVRGSRKDRWLCCAPWRKETKASVKISCTGCWRDFGEDSGGGLLELVQRVRDLPSRKEAWVLVRNHLNLPETHKSDYSPPKPHPQPYDPGQPKPLPNTETLAFYQRELDKHGRRAWLRDRRGLSDRTIDAAGIGWSEKQGRYQIPIQDSSGQLVNVRRYRPEAPAEQKMRNWQGHGGTVLYPGIPGAADPVLVCEGEFDTLLARQHGLSAITCTAGAKQTAHYLAEQAALFKDREVVLSFDHDETGVAAAQMLGQAIKGVAARVRQVIWPEGSKKGFDVSDWLHGANQSAAEMLALARDFASQTNTATNRPEAKNSEPVNAAQLADEYLTQRKTPLYRWKECWYQWTGTHYVEISDGDTEADLVAFLRAWDMSMAKQFLTQNILLNLRSLCNIPGTVEPPVDLSTKPPTPIIDRIVFNNGELDVSQIAGTWQQPGQLEEWFTERGFTTGHSPKVFNLTALPYDYAPLAQCPQWEAFLEEIQPDPDNRRLLQQWTGYLLTPDVCQRKFLLCVGEGANGKSIFLGVLRALLGHNNTSAVPLEAFNPARSFPLVSLQGKLANIVEELGELDKTAEGLLKDFVSGGKIQAERKHKDPFIITPTARLMYATNCLPRFADRSSGLWDRMLLVPFSVTIPPEKQNPALKEIGPGSRQTSPFQAELSGIFNWAMRGLIDLRQVGRFLEPEVCRQAKVEYQLEVNPARQFLLDNYEQDQASEVSRQELYQVYTKFCLENGYKPFGDSQLGKEVRRCFPKICSAQHRDWEGKQRRYYVGLQVKI